MSADKTDRVYCKLMGCKYVPITKRKRVYDICDHPTIYFRHFDDHEMYRKLNRHVRNTMASTGAVPNNEGKIPVIIILPDGRPRANAIVCTYMEHWRDLFVGGLAGDFEREIWDTEPGVLEWLPGLGVLD